MLLASLMLFAAMWWPVVLSALAPAEVVPRDPQVISAPIDGVVREVLVLPNEPVTAGTPLLQLEDAELQSSVEVAERALLVARAELQTTQLGGFVNASSKGSQISTCEGTDKSHH